MLLVFSLISLSLLSTAQVTQLKFTALLNGSYIALDSIRTKNLTHPGDTVLYWPDTTLVLGYVGINEPGSYTGDFSLKLLVENPVCETTKFQIITAENASVFIRVSDIAGKATIERKVFLSAGIHTFTYKPAYRGVSIVSASLNSLTKSLKIIYAGTEKGMPILAENGVDGNSNLQKTINSSLSFIYAAGDMLKFTGWYHGINAVLTAAPLSNALYVFNYSLNAPCPDEPQFIYGGQVYTTVQIGLQCWMKENLNIGTMVPSIYTQGSSHSYCSNNGIIEKYCFNNDHTNCDIYGGLYDWDEMMQYTSTAGSQGICPIGWHIPTDQQWCTLISYLNPGYNCNHWGYSGSDAGGKLKETEYNHWLSPNLGATNESGFTAFGGGHREAFGNFINFNYDGSFSTSSENTPTKSIFWFMWSNYEYAARQFGDKVLGLSIRCLRND